MDKPFPAYKGNDSYVFVCYSHDDAAAVYSDLLRLHEQGVNLWYDEGVAAGRAWRAEIANAVQGASKLLYFISDASTRSTHCTNEVEYALGKHVEIVPVYLDEIELGAELDLALSRIQALHRSSDAMYERHLLDALSGATRAAKPLAPIPRKYPGIAIASSGAVALILTAWWYLINSTVVDSDINPNSIAVLPLLNISGGERAAIFSNGLTEDVINSLSRIPGLQVSSRRDSFSLPAGASSAEVRQRLRVNYYIEGSVRLVDDDIRVVIRLIDSENGRLLQSRPFESTSEDFFEIQDKITRLAVANLRVSLPEDNRSSISSASSIVNIDAYILYRRGIEELQKPMTEKSFEQALDWFSQSLQLDPDYTAGHAGNCRTYSSGFNVIHNNPLYMEEAEQACAAALALDPNLSIVHNALGDLYWKTGKYQQAEESYLRALAIDQNDTLALTGLAESYSSQQKTAEAEEMYRQAIASQPGNWLSFNSLGNFYFNNGRYREASEAFTEVVSLDVEHMQGWSNFGASLMLLGNFEQAAPAFERSIAIEPQANTYSNLGLMYYYLGRIPEAITALESATSLAPDNHLYWANLGDALSFSGQQARATQMFDSAEGLAEILLAVNPNDAITMVDLAWIKAMLGKMQEAQTLIVDAASIIPNDPQAHFIHGLILTRMGDDRAAVVKLESALGMGYPLTMLMAEPHLKRLRQNQEFKNLLE